MAKKKKWQKLRRTRAAPLPPSGSPGAAPGGSNPATGQTPPASSGNPASGNARAAPIGKPPGTGSGIRQKARQIVGKAAKTGSGEVKNTAIDAVKGTNRYVTQKVSQHIHLKFSEAEQDNAALETAHEAERIGEQLARSGLHKGKKLIRDRFSKRNLGAKPPPANLGAARQAAAAANSTNMTKTVNPALPPPHGTITQTPALPPPHAAINRLPALPTPPGVAGTASPPVPVVIPGAAVPPAVSPAISPPSGATGGKFRHGADPSAPPPPQFTLHHAPAGGGSGLGAIWNTPAATFGTHVDFTGAVKPGLLGRTLHHGKEVVAGGLRMSADRAALQLRGNIDRAADDNSAFKAAHQAEQFAERPAGYLLNKGKNAVTAPIKKLSNKVRGKLRHRYRVRKQAFLRRHKNIAQARGAVMKAKAIVRELVRNAKPVLTGLGVCLIIYFFCAMIVGPIAAALSKAGTEYLVTTTYPVASQDLTSSTVQWTELQTALEQRIENIETEFPHFDEYRYDVEPMTHDPFALISYLAAMHLEFPHPAVQGEIAALFAEVNTLELIETTETRHDADGHHYDWEILTIRLKPKPFVDVITPKLAAADATGLYDVFMGSGGNQQAFGNPFSFNWQGSISSYYGNRKNPTGPGYEFHTGIDIAAAGGTPIQSVQDGAVVVAGWHDLYGNYIVIRNEAGVSSLYAHCSALYGNVGDTVRTGQIIAAVGSTGRSTGDHVHFEIKIGEERINPLFYIQAYESN